MKKTDQPKVAVLLAAYNGMQWIEDQIHSIFTQNNVDITLYISVDRSTDGTDLWAKNLADKSDNVVLLPYGERYGSAGRNFYRLIKDVDFSDFDYVSLADQDDIWLPEKLISGITKMSKENAMGYSSNMIAFWEDGSEKQIFKSANQTEFDYLFESGSAGCTYILDSGLAKKLKSLLEQNSRVVLEISSHDWLIYAFARSLNCKWVIDYDSFILYRQHGSNVAGANLGLSAKIKRFKILFSKESWFLNDMKLIHSLLGVNLDFKTLFFNMFKLRRNKFYSLFIFIFMLVK